MHKTLNAGVCRRASDAAARRAGRWRRALARFFMCGLLWGGWALAPAALAQAQAPAAAPELFQPLAAARLADVTPVQSQRLAQIRQRPTTRGVDLVRMDLAALQGKRLRMSLPAAAAVEFDKSAVVARAPDNFIWRGTSLDTAGQGTLVVHGDDVTGSVRQDGKLYRIEPLGNGVHAVIQVDESRFPPEHPPSFQRPAAGPAVLPPVAVPAPFPAARPAAAAAPAAPPGAAAMVGVDVAVAYTAAAKAAVADIGATIELAVAEANQSYLNSAVQLRLTLVDTYEVAYAEDGKEFETILADFAAMPATTARRDSAGADLVALIIAKADYCGLANGIRVGAEQAYAVVYYDCATGYYSFAHELGHLQGARHDPANDPTTTPFAHGHGLQHTVAPGWRTIMAYDCPGSCPRLQYWSNPGVDYQGAPTGTAARSDNARVLNDTAASVAAFRAAPPPAGVAGGPRRGVANTGQ